MAKREFLQLAYDIKPKHFVGGWLASEKLDGIRCFWDGSISSGIPAPNVPYANTAKDTKVRFATGLWSRYGKVIQAPEWWYKQLPPYPLDGELYTKRCDRQNLKSYVSKHTPIDSEWRNVTFRIFGMPSYEAVFADGMMNSAHFKKRFSDIMEWVKPRIDSNLVLPKTFRGECHRMQKIISPDNEIAIVIPQRKLPLSHTTAIQDASIYLKSLGENAEGLILRNPESIWVPERSHNLIKIKPMKDSEAKVVGYTWGKKTEKGSKLLGLMGSMLLEWKATPEDKIVKFSISGFEESERQMHILDTRPGRASTDEPYNFHGRKVSEDWQNPMFPRGTMVTFKYRQLTRDGVPEEARYMRIRDDG